MSALRMGLPLLLSVTLSCMRPHPEPEVVPGITLNVVAAPNTDTVIYRRSVTRAGVDSATGTPEGTVTARGAGADTAQRAETVHQALGGPIFDSNVLEMVIASLPLSPNFTTELPFFIYERDRIASSLRHHRARDELHR